MKNFLIILLISLILGGCDKQKSSQFEPYNNPFEVMPIRFQQNVLIEYFSDEALSATVENGLLVEQLKLGYPHRLFAVNYHSNDFLATSYTNYISTALGGLINISKAAINRIPGSQTIGGENGLVLMSPQNWEGSILRALRTPDAPLSIAIETGVKENANGFINVFIAHKEAITDDTRLMLFLVEDNIEPIGQEGSTPFFKHHNVLRNVLTSFEGDIIDLKSGSEDGIIQKISYSNFNLQDYNTGNLKVIAFVYKNDPDYKKKQILNVQEVDFYGVHYWDVD